MTSGRFVVIVIVMVTLLFGAALWWANTRAYYAPLDVVEVSVSRADGTLISLDISDAEGIDAATSPLRYRACFTLDDAAALTEAMPYDTPTPLVATDLFDCFDAFAIGAALEEGRAQAYLSAREVSRGVDQVVAIYPDGRGYAWTQLNGTLE